MSWAELKNIITKIDWKEFHFIRPWALYLYKITIRIVSIKKLLCNLNRCYDQFSYEK